ncbi:hypothetical protein J6590_107127 [Homalodisca vitripennis]|nr:hypothetical protein J6590_107127 [Homalodisca vitripennis]
MCSDWPSKNGTEFGANGQREFRLFSLAKCVPLGQVRTAQNLGPTVKGKFVRLPASVIQFDTLDRCVSIGQVKTVQNLGPTVKGNSAFSAWPSKNGTEFVANGQREFRLFCLAK